jgi:hypothetical protein
MFLEIGIILIVLWFFGFTFYPLGGLIHILLVLAIISIVWNFLGGKRID